MRALRIVCICVPLFEFIVENCGQKVGEQEFCFYFCFDSLALLASLVLIFSLFFPQYKSSAMNWIRAKISQNCDSLHDGLCVCLKLDGPSQSFAVLYIVFVCVWSGPHFYRDGILACLCLCWEARHHRTSGGDSIYICYAIQRSIFHPTENMLNSKNNAISILYHFVWFTFCLFTCSLHVKKRKSDQSIEHLNGMLSKKEPR